MLVILDTIVHPLPKNVGWQTLGTHERTKALGAQMGQTQSLVVAEPEGQRVALWRAALWDWMCQNRKQPPAPQKQKSP